jgi:hypothetical protein
MSLCSLAQRLSEALEQDWRALPAQASCRPTATGQFGSSSAAVVPERLGAVPIG